ncbi:MAG: HTTM domain-containing protein [Byssovorax sp.]
MVKALLRWGAPINLAMLRIAIPTIVLLTPETHEAMRWSSLLRADLQVAPPGFAWALTLVPVTAGATRAALVLLVLSCLAAIVGYRSRASLAIAALTSFYVLGIPQLGGTVTHNHHLVWLLALLAASPCGDALSIDAAVTAYRAVGPPTGMQRPTLAHAAPILVAWILIGLVFFFPGFWKLRSSGAAWIWSDNLRNQMYWKWYETGGPPPRLRVDGSPWLCRAGALGAVVFELSFGILVLVPRLRAWAVSAALAFHALTSTLMRISFPSLWLCYGVFARWNRALPQAGRWLFEDVLVIQWSGRGTRIEGLIAALRATDVLRRVVYDEVPETAGAPGLEARRESAEPGAPPIVAQGWAALLHLAARSPALWPALPIIYLAARSGQSFAVFHASRRTQATPPLRPSGWPPALMGAGVIGAALWAGARNLQQAWPFACYPTFQWMAPAEIPALTIEATLDGGEIVELPRASELDAARGQKLWGMEWSLSGVTGAPDPARLRAYLQVLSAERADLGTTLRRARSIRFYRGFFSVIPEDRGKPPVRRVLLVELTPVTPEQALPAPRSPAP